jgi:hypothetical protein
MQLWALWQLELVVSARQLDSVAELVRALHLTDCILRLLFCHSPRSKGRTIRKVRGGGRKNAYKHKR